MKFKRLNEIGIILTSAVIFGCSKQDPPPTAEKPTQQPVATSVTTSNQNQKPPAAPVPTVTSNQKPEASPAPTVTTNENREASSPQADTPDKQPSIGLSVLYCLDTFQYNGVRVSEYTNTGSIGILAFKAKWTIVDDLGDPQMQGEDKYTSETPFMLGGTNSSPVSHVILPGETIFLITQVTHGDDGDETTVTATTKENFAEKAAYLGTTNIDDWRDNRKFTFEVEKIVPQGAQ